MLRVDKLTVAYGQVEAVREISFRVPDNSIVTLIGPNGAGKTTTINAVSGLVPVRGGRVTFAGTDITALKPHKRVRMGVVQVPEGRLVLAGMSVRENLELGGFGRDKAEIQRDLRLMEERFPILSRRRDQMAGSLSGGEQQMLALARALMARPKLLLLDEPSLGLAPLVVREVFRIVRQLKDEGLTILLVEQNARRSLAVSDHAYVIESGSIVLEGKSSDLEKDPVIVKAYLGQCRKDACQPE